MSKDADSTAFVCSISGIIQVSVGSNRKVIRHYSLRRTFYRNTPQRKAVIYDIIIKGQTR